MHALCKEWSEEFQRNNTLFRRPTTLVTFNEAASGRKVGWLLEAEHQVRLAMRPKCR
jgi:hypothetical protein